GSGLAAGVVDIHPGRYAIRSPVSRAHRRYVFLEQGVGAAGFNFLLNASIAWLIFRGAEMVPLWGQQSIAGDTIGTSIILPFLTCLIATRLVRGHVRSGKVAPLGWSRDTQPWLGWLPRGTLARGLVRRVEGGEPGARHAGGERGLPARVGEHARDEARAQGGVAQASLLLDGEERQARHDRAREEARAAPPRPPAVAVHPHALQAA